MARRPPRQRACSGTAQQRIKRLAETIYELPARGPAFEYAYGRWPRYNDGGTHTDEAAHYILDELRYAATCVHGIPIPEAIEDDLNEEIFEMIYAGLT